MTAQQQHVFEMYLTVISVIAGGLVGSFLNVCIYRVPLSLSVVTPGSRCDRCGVPVRWYDNIPLISFLVLQGRCRFCGVYFGSRHFWIEGLTALCAGAVFSRYGISFESLYYFVFACVLIVVTFIDMDHKIIPDGISYWGLAIGLLLSIHFQIAQMRWAVSLYESLLGIALGGGLLWAVAWVYEKITLREGLGLGDVKLMAFFGAHVGVKGVCFTLFYGSLLGSIVGLTLMALGGAHRKTAIPFGPYLCAGLILYFLRLHTLFPTMFE
ncbi:MAG: prepilin peptidase [Bdellovibrionota bacterium]